MKILKISALLALVSFFTAPAIAGTLEDVQSRGYVKCGVTTGLLGFAAPDDSGKWSGFDVDVCRAVAAAVLGDSSKARKELRWKPQYNIRLLAQDMVAEEFKKIHVNKKK